MSTATPQPQPAPPVRRAEPPREIRVYGHTALFYWWPVWVCGYIMALITWVDGGRAVIVPEGSEYKLSQTVQGTDGPRNLVLLPPNATFPAMGTEAIEDNAKVRERVHPSKNLGVIFAAVLLVVILITNIHLRGLSSAIVISLILVVTLTFALLDWWEKIFSLFGRLNMHMNMGFYVTFSTALFIAWLVVVLGYDRMSYWRVTPGQITHEVVFGGGQKAFDTEGMAFEKLRDDLFRHWVLGFGSGDMIMYPMISGGSQREEMHIHNVLFVGSKLRAIQEMIAAQPDRPA